MKNPKNASGGIKNVVLSRYYENQLYDYKKWLTRLGYALSTVKGCHNHLCYFFKYLQDRSITSVYDINSIHIQEYNSLLHSQAKGSKHIKRLLHSIALFSKYYEQSYYYKIVFEKPYIESSLPTQRILLSVGEVQELFGSLGGSVKDHLYRSILHLCYSCGLRIGEAIRVRSIDIDYAKQLLYVLPGKNYKGRYLPLSSVVVKDLQVYEAYARKLINRDSSYFLIGQNSDQLSSTTLNKYLKDCVAQSSLSKRITAHCLRHSIATHLLQGGMDLELIQQFLGHKTMASTQLYVHITNDLLL